MRQARKRQLQPRILLSGRNLASHFTGQYYTAMRKYALTSYSQ